MVGTQVRAAVSCMAETAAQQLHPLPASVLAVLMAAREQDHVITRAKLAQLLYLADLRAVEEGGTAFSGATWRRHHHGPHDQALVRAEDSVVETLQLVDRSDRDRSFEHGAGTLRLVLDIDDPLDDPHMEIVRSVVAEFGGLSAGALGDLSSQTPPMVEAEAAGDLGVLLDLSKARRRRQARARIERARAARARGERQSRDAGVEQELRAELGAAADSLLRVNREVLGDQ